MADQGRVDIECRTSYDPQIIKKASDALRSNNIPYAVTFGSLSIVSLALSIMDALITLDQIVFIATFCAISFFAATATFVFLILVFCVYHDERGEPQCDRRWLKPVLMCIPARFKSIKIYCDMVTVKYHVESPSTRTDDLENSENATPQSAEVVAIPQRLERQAPKEHSEVPAEVQLEGLESAQAGRSSSVSSPLPTLGAIADSLPTDCVPLRSPKQESTFSEISEMASGGSLTDLPSFSDDQLEQGTSERKDIRGRATTMLPTASVEQKSGTLQHGKETVEAKSSAGVQEYVKVYQLKQFLREQVTSGASSSNISPPGQVGEDEMAETVSELRRRPMATADDPLLPEQSHSSEDESEKPKM